MLAVHQPPLAENSEEKTPSAKLKGRKAKAEGGDKAPEPQRRKRALAVGAVVAPLLEPTLAKVLARRGVALGRLLPHWHVLCPVLAKWSFPEGLKGDTLTVAVASDAVKQELIYMAPHIIESANMLLGYRAVAKVRAVTRVFAEPQPKAPVTQRLHPTAEMRDRAKALCKHVQDDALRTALTGLAETLERTKKT